MTELTHTRLTQIHTNIICTYYNLPKGKYFFPIDKEGGVFKVFKEVVLQLRKDGNYSFNISKGSGDLMEYLSTFYMALNTADPIAFIYNKFNARPFWQPQFHFFFVWMTLGKFEIENTEILTTEVKNTLRDYHINMSDHLMLPKEIRSTRVLYEDYEKIHLDAFNEMYNVILNVLKESYEMDKSEENQQKIDKLNILYAKAIQQKRYSDNYEELEENYKMIDKWLEE